MPSRARAVEVPQVERHHAPRRVLLDEGDEQVAHRQGDADAVRATGQWIASVQKPNGEIPWFTGGHTDPWDHVESAMGLSVAGQWEAAERALHGLWRRLVPTPAAPQPVAQAAPVSEDHHVRAAKVLSLAQDTADRLTSTAKAESDKLLADARAQADALVSEARQTAETTVADARAKADALLSDAQNRSETQLRQAQEKADALQADAERKHSEIMGTINQQRTVLEGRLEQLRTFEREYRTRLKTYLESQLEELGQRGSAAPVDSAAGNEGGGFNQFNRGAN